MTFKATKLLNNYLQVINWLDILPLHDVNLAYSTFLNKYIDAINFYYPNNHINRSAKKENKEVKHWLTPNLLQCIKYKHKTE